MRLEKKQPPHATSVKPSGIPAETFWFTTIEGLSVLTKATPSIDTFADMFPLLLQVEVYCKSTSTLLFLVSVCFFCFVGWYAKKTSRNSFQHSTAKQIIGSFWSLLFFRGWKLCKWWMGQLLENPINYIPEALSKTHMKPTNIKCFGIWCLVFLLNLGDFQVPLAQINCLARSPFVKPFPVALGQTKSRHIHDQHLSGEGYQKPTAGYDIIFGTFWYIDEIIACYVISSSFDVLGTNLRFIFHRWQDPGSP